MRKWLWIAPMLLMAGCSKTPQAATGPQAATVAQAATTDQVQQPGGVDAASAPGTDPAPLPDAATATVIPSGTPLRVRVDESLSTRHNRRGDHFTATLIDAVHVNGQDVLPAGTRLDGHVLVATPSGRLKGRARLVLELDSFDQDGHRHRIQTTAAARVSGNHKRRNIAIIGGGAATGATIGAVAGGGAGAAIGAGAGAAAGTVSAAITGKKQVTIPAETVVRFTLGRPVGV